MNNSNSSRGSLWHQWDLHLHTPSSYDYLDKSITNQQIVDVLCDANVRVVAITDHHKIDVNRIQELQALGKGRLTILPGIEFRSYHGAKPVHYISIFPETCDLVHVWTTLQGALGLTDNAIKQKGGDENVYVPLEKAAQKTRELGGVVSIHAGAKSNSIDNISNKEHFQQRIKYDITKKWIDLLEIGRIKDIDVHLNTIFPITGLERPLIICSDNHKITEYHRKARLWLRADPTFRGLLMAQREPIGRVYIGDSPPDHIRVRQNSTKYIRGVSFRRKPSAPDTQKWFDGGILFNPGLVAIIGNKGSGKSALSDTIGLLGATKNADCFSFLTKKRFRHPSGGYAQHFEASVEWESGEKITRGLAEPNRDEDLERVKYLPQDHVETICNELTGIDQAGFETELKAVIFSHVPESSRLNQTTLDEIVRFRTNEKQKAIDSLLKQLRDISRSRSALEAKADPKSRWELEEKIRRREFEIKTHEKAKSAEISDPSSDVQLQNQDSLPLEELKALEKIKAEIEIQIAEAKERQSVAERRYAVAERLLERLNNFQREFEVFTQSLGEDAGELGLESSDLVSMTFKTTSVEAIRNEAINAVASENSLLGNSEAEGLNARLSKYDNDITNRQAKLDAPNRAYQLYLKQVADWDKKLKELEGDDTDPDSLNGLKSILNSLNELPGKIAALKSQQAELSHKIHAEKMAHMEVYRTLYEPVQRFIDSHILSKDKLKLEFRAQLVDRNFTTSLFSYLALNRRGSFMGVDEGKTKADELIEATIWEDWKSIEKFIETVDQALHQDEREKPPTPVRLSDQLVKGKEPEDLFNLLYGLEYIHPKFMLRWEGKDLSILSPGERGTLLLVFYLLVDKSDLPLVIDQPEGNLDNHTVVKALVDCIREARKRRQVFIVTHNPNLAVVCDADQVIHAHMDKENDNAVTYTSGSLENPAMSKYVTDVLEGTRQAFNIRGLKYDVGDSDEQ